MSGRAEVVGHLDHQLEPVGAGQPVGEVLGPVRLEPLAHLLDGAEQPEQLRRRRAAAAPRARSTKDRRGSAPAAGGTSGVAGQRAEIGLLAAGLLPDAPRRAGARCALTSSVPAACSTAAPTRLRPEHRLAQRIPQRRRDRAARGPSGSQSRACAEPRRSAGGAHRWWCRAGRSRASLRRPRASRRGGRRACPSGGRAWCGRCWPAARPWTCCRRRGSRAG